MRWLLLVLLGCKGRADTDTDAVSDTDPAQDTDTAADLEDDDVGSVCPFEPVALPTPPTPVQSFPFLPTSNGFVSAQWVTEARGVPVRFPDGTWGRTDQAHQLATFTDHLAKNPTPSTSTRDLLWDFYFGLRIDDDGTWLNTIAEEEVGYVPGTGIIRVVQRVGDFEVEQHWFTPFQAGGKRDLVAIAKVTNVGSTSHTLGLYSLENVHTGGEGSVDGESVSKDGDAIVESRGGDTVRHTPLGTPISWAAAPGGDDRNPWARVSSDRGYPAELVSGNDVAVGFEWWFDTVDPGESFTRGVILSLDGEPALDLDPDALLAAEKADWDAWHAVETPPDGLTADELAVFEQATAVLRMGQVREEGRGKGQILASLPPGIWNMSWPRDGAYAAVGLVHSGHAQQARDFLDFVIASDSGYYADYLGLDDYMVSVCRYTGDGTEESDGAGCPDGSDAGPNIELDDWGLFLWAYGEYAAANPSDPWIDETLPAVLAGVADPLVQTIDPNRDLLVPDSSIWERHWDECFPNGRKRFSYSSIFAVKGLRVAAELSGDSRYTEAADQLRRGLITVAEEGGPVVFPTDECPLVASAPEETCEGCGPYDGSVIEIVNLDVIRPESALAKGTLLGLQEALLMENGSPGLLRNDDGTGTTNPYPWYDDQEWVVIDLRVAAAWAKVADATGDDVARQNAETLVGWITAQARANHDLIPELLSDGITTSQDDDDYVRPGTDLGSEFQGAVPMCGFGPGAYILALEALRD